jgi:hypothetical protein
VVNVILKTNYDGDEVRVRGGTSTEGGRDTWDLSWAGGKTGDNWSVTYALQYTKRDPLFGRDRPQMDDADDAPYPSWNMEQRKVGFRPTAGLALIDPTTASAWRRPPAPARSSTASTTPPIDWSTTTPPTPSPTPAACAA